MVTVPNTFVLLRLACGCPSGNIGANAEFNMDAKVESVGCSHSDLDGPGCLETPQNHLLNHPKQVLIKQHLKIQSLGISGLWPSRHLLAAPTVIRMVLGVEKNFQMAKVIKLDNFDFKIFSKSIPLACPG